MSRTPLSSSVKSLSNTKLLPLRADASPARRLHVSPFRKRVVQHTRKEQSATKKPIRPRQAKSEHLQQIELELCKQLEEIAANEPISLGKLQLYQEAFARIIETDDENKALLTSIKQGYEDLFERKLADIAEADQQIVSLTKDLERERKSNKTRKREFTELLEDSAEVNKRLNEKKTLINQVKQKLANIHKASLLRDAESQQAFELLKAKEARLQHKLQRITDKYKQLKLARSKHQKLIQVLRSKGYNVDEEPDRVNRLSVPGTSQAEFPSAVQPIYIEKDTLKLDSDSPNIPSKFDQEQGSPLFSAMSPIGIEELPNF